MNATTESRVTPLDFSLLALQHDADAVRIAQQKFDDRAAHMMATLRPNLDRIADAYWMGVKELKALTHGSAHRKSGRVEVRPLFSWTSLWPVPTVWNEETRENFRLAEVTDEWLTVMVKTPRPGGSVAEVSVKVPVSVLNMTGQQVADYVVDHGKYYPN